MAKPIVDRVKTFDANYDYVFKFSYTGNQPFKNKIIITDTQSNKEFNYEIETMKFEHTLEGGTLSNGHLYTVQFIVYDKDDIASTISDKVLFTCYSNPLFKFDGLIPDQTNHIHSVDYKAEIKYEQTEDRSLKTFRFYLLDSTKMKIVFESGTLFYPTDSLSFIYKGLENETLYYIYCTGETVDDVVVDTDYIPILSQYVVSNTFSNLNLTNNPYGGYIQINTNIVAISGETEDKYHLENGIVSIKNGCVLYQEGFIINGDNVWTLKIKNPIAGSKIAQQSNDINDISLYYYPYESENYFKLAVDNGLTKYILYSDSIKLKQDEFITIYVTRKNNLYQLDLVRNG